MTRHVLKLWTDQFDAMQSGAKRADVRRCDDRNFLRGDEVIYRDCAVPGEKYSGRALLARITHLVRWAGDLELLGRVSRGREEGLLLNMVVLSVEVLEAGTFDRLSSTTVVAVKPAGFRPSKTGAVTGGTCGLCGGQISNKGVSCTKGCPADDGRGAAPKEVGPADHSLEECVDGRCVYHPVCQRCGQPGHVASDPGKEPAGNNCRAAQRRKDKGVRRG